MRGTYGSGRVMKVIQGCERGLGKVQEGLLGHFLQIHRVVKIGFYKSVHAYWGSN